MFKRFNNDDIEAVARFLIRKRIQGSGWYPDTSDEERNKLIERDVEGNWHLMIHEAAKQLTDRLDHQSGLAPKRWRASHEA